MPHSDARKTVNGDNPHLSYIHVDSVDLPISRNLGPTPCGDSTHRLLLTTFLLMPHRRHHMPPASSSSSSSSTERKLDQVPLNPTRRAPKLPAKPRFALGVGVSRCISPISQR
eukprot:6049312-Amphidinium_carterae.1